MSRIKTIVEVSLPVTDENGELVSDKNGNTETKPVLFELLHWGLSLTYWTDEKGNSIPVNYTVAICMDIKTGRVFTFTPTELTIIGKEIKQ
jgi:hypothetical protein